MGCHRVPRRQLVSSITNSRESTSIIISIPPGKRLLVVISRSLCECHMNAQPRSLEGLACELAGRKLPVLVPIERTVASGPRYGLPLYQAPFVKMSGSGSVAGPPPDT